MADVVRITKDDYTIGFDADKLEKIKACCGFIDSEFSFGDDSDLPKELLIQNSTFGSPATKDCFDYLSHHEYKPPTYGKIISKNVEDHFSHPFDLDLACRYPTNQSIIRLRSAAKYFQIPSLMAFCNVMIGLSIWIDATEVDGLKEVMKRHGITAEYNIRVEKDLKQKHPFLNF